MKKYDEQILWDAVMAAKVKESLTGGYLSRGDAFFELAITYQGTVLTITVVSDNEKTAKELAFLRLKQKLKKRLRTGWTRADLDKECQKSQKHLLFWRDHLDLLPIVQKAAKLEEDVPAWAYSSIYKEIAAKDKAVSRLNKFIKENLGKSFDYSPKHLMRMYEQIPPAWKKAPIVESDKNHRNSIPGEKNTTTAKISFSERDGKVIYRVCRSIVCYREGSTYHIGKPSDHCVLTADVGSEEVAHERCMEIAGQRIELANRLAKAVSLAS